MQLDGIPPFTWKRVAVAMISRICPISRAKIKTPINHAAVMNSNSPSLSGFGFFPIDVAVFVANAKHRTYGCPFPLKTHRSVPKPESEFEYHHEIPIENTDFSFQYRLYTQTHRATMINEIMKCTCYLDNRCMHSKCMP